MIVGLGTDLIAVDRVRRVHRKHPERFLSWIYTPEERAHCLRARDPAERLAARWAAKEACMKALGTGWSSGVQFADIAVLSAPTGAPRLALAAGAAERARALGATSFHLSLSHADNMALATVILEGT
ncbi:MAG: holo-ACP synthase [Planctomycetota bacterium]